MAGFFSHGFVLTAVLISAVIFVNGWTDAPGAIATCVASGSLSYRAAVLLAAVFNMLGLVVMFFVNNSLTQTMQSAVALGRDTGLTALAAAMIAIAAFAVAAWYFGIPTSESHALLAALAGAAVAGGDAPGISRRVIFLTALGLVITTVFGFALGFACRKLMVLCKLQNRRDLWRRTEIAAAALLAFIHGAQDGQKFCAVLLLGLSLASPSVTVPPAAAVFFCAALLFFGTLTGGGRIIKKVGSGITTVDECGGVCCDAAAFITILFCTLLGIPVSTTHTKTTAVVGLGAANGVLRLRPFGEIAFAWVLTFPCCFIISYAVTKISLNLPC